MKLLLRTDKPEAYVGVWQDEQELVAKNWVAHRDLSQQLHQTIHEVLVQAGTSLEKISGIAVYEGPGSFTGLRIGISVANALAYSFGVPIVGCSGEKWQQQGSKKLNKVNFHNPISPVYGGAVHTTKPKK